MSLFGWLSVRGKQKEKERQIEEACLEVEQRSWRSECETTSGLR